MADKIKAIQPMITVGGKIEKPCYSITYYDTSDKMWHIGFGSFDLANVKKWLKEEFEVVAETADVAEVKHGYNATYINPVDEFVCSVCSFKCTDYTEIVTEENDDIWYRECEFDYCPRCGAKMDENI